MIFSIELIVIAILVFGLIVMSAFLVRYGLRSKRLAASVVQLIIDKNAIAEELDRLSFISSNSTDIENGFIKFLSETRESAYEYIADVQATILELKTAMDSGKDEDIAASYKKLIEFLPDNTVGMTD
jgi:hypothetical protein